MKKKLNWDGNYIQRDGEKVRMINKSFVLQNKQRKISKIIKLAIKETRLSLIKFLLEHNIKYLDKSLDLNIDVDYISMGKIFYFSIYTLKRKEKEIYNIDNFCIDFNNLNLR